MLCDICKQNPAKVHLTQIVEGKTKKIDLCEACSKAKGIDESGFSLADLLMGLGAAQELEPVSSATGALKCGQCGFTQAEFKKTGRLGCPECYRTFSEGLEGLLKTMHKGIRHTGKVPESFLASRTMEEQLSPLQKRLEQAIAREDFEQAATLRDEIRRVRERHTAPRAGSRS